MLSYVNVTRHDNTLFAEYLDWPEYSHSFLKYQKNGVVPPKEETVNMTFGKIVDAILCNEVTGELYSHALYPHAMKQSEAITEKFGYAMQHMVKQPSYRGSLDYNGFRLPVKVRLDMQLGDILLFENKVTFSGIANRHASQEAKIKSILAVIKYMGYDNQALHQLGMSGVKEGYIMIHSAPLNETFLFKRLQDPNEVVASQDWWKKQVAMFGL